MSGRTPSSGRSGFWAHNPAHRINDRIHLPIHMSTEYSPFRSEARPPARRRHPGSRSLALHHQIGRFGRLVCGLKPGHLGGWAPLGLAIYTFWVAGHARRQRTIHVDLQEIRDLVSCPVAIGAPVRGGVENNGYALLGQQRSNIRQLLLERVAFFLVITWIRGKSFPQCVRFQHGYIHPACTELLLQGGGESRFPAGRKTRDPNAESVVMVRFHSKHLPEWDRRLHFRERSTF